MSKNSKHAGVKRFIGVRALVTTLMLVVDYVIPDGNGRTEAFIYDTWVKFITSNWPIALREQVMRWAGQRRQIATDHVIDNPLPKPKCIDSLPFVKKFEQYERFTGQDVVNAVIDAVDNERRIAVSNGVVTREYLEQRVLDAISGLPNYARSVLRGAWSMLEGHSSEFDDARIELVGMAFDLANGTGIDARDLCQYARHVLDMRLAPMPPKASERREVFDPMTGQFNTVVADIPQSLTYAQKLVADECGGLCAFLIEKNRKYGNSALEPMRVFSKASVNEQLKVRADDKLARILRGDANLEDEDVLKDLAGYLVLMLVERRMRKAGG